MEEVDGKLPLKWIVAKKKKIKYQFLRKLSFFLFFFIKNLVSFVD